MNAPPLDQKDWIGVAVEEYRTLRTEALGGIEQGQRTLQIALVAIAAITTVAVGRDAVGVAVNVGLVCTTPALALAGAIMYLDELARTVQAGAHLATLEAQIARIFAPQPPPLTWQSGVEFRASRHWALTTALFAASTPAVLLGLAHLARDSHWIWFAGALGVAMACVLIAGINQHAVHARLILTEQARASGAAGRVATP